MFSQSGLYIRPQSVDRNSTLHTQLSSTVVRDCHDLPLLWGAPDVSRLYRDFDELCWILRLYALSTEASTGRREKPQRRVSLTDLPGNEIDNQHSINISHAQVTALRPLLKLSLQGV